MHDLRRQALESGKTISRKARSRQATGVNSRSGSAPSSRSASKNPNSRHVSDEEEGNLSDSTTWSLNSIDGIISAEDADVPINGWESELADTVSHILEPKGSNAAARQERLARYTRTLQMHYARDDIQGSFTQLLSALMKVIKAENTERDAVLALRALAVTIITTPSDSMYESLFPPLRRAVLDSQSPDIKAAAIQALGTAAFYGGASTEDIEQVMEFLLEIVESDGVSVGAEDVSEVVVAAMEEWGLLATQMDDLEESSESAMEAFVDQLESSNLHVQVAAGENIALLYEKSYTPLEEDEEPPSEDELSDPEDESPSDGVKMIKRYNVYRHESQLKRILANLATVSSRRISKKDKKSLHTNFSDILHSVEHPTRGPRYQTAVSQDTGKRYGSRLTVRLQRSNEIRIDQWWKLHRLKALRRMLQGGFVTHCGENEAVMERLPMV